MRYMRVRGAPEGVGKKGPPMASKLSKRFESRHIL